MRRLVVHSLWFIVIFLFLISLSPYFLNSSRVYAYSEQTYFIHQDNLGSVVAVTSDATVSAQLSYSSYGSSNSTTDSSPTERGYTGQIQDTSTSLSYYNSRYYDPIISRFISADSVSGGNRYAYVSNNPIVSSDPTGNVMTAGDGGGGGGTSTSNYGSITPVTNTPSINTPQIGSSQYYNGTLGDPNASSVAPSWAGHTPQGATEAERAMLRDQVLNAMPYVAAGLSGGSCAFGFLPGCVATNVLLGAAWVEQITSGGQSKEFTEPALAAATIATGGQDLMNLGRGVVGVVRNARAQFSAPPGNATKTYNWYTLRYKGSGKGTPSTFEPWDFQKDATNLAQQGNYQGAWNCIAGTCDQMGFTYAFDNAGQLPSGVGGIYKNGNILLQPSLTSNPSELIRIFGHECGHGCDALMLGMKNGVLAAYQTEARQQYFNSFYYVNTGNIILAQDKYRLALKLAGLIK